MKKSIVTAVLCSVLMCSYANANHETGIHHPVSTSKIAEVKGLNSFCKAIIKGNFELVKQLIALGEDINQKSLGKTPAMYAARYNKAKILQLLIDKGANLSAISYPEKLNAKKLAVLANAQKSLSVLEAASK